MPGTKEKAAEMRGCRRILLLDEKDKSLPSTAFMGKYTLELLDTANQILDSVNTRVAF